MPVSFVGLVVTTSVVLFVLLVYRQLDKNNRSLEKVRRYSEVVRTRLGEFVEEKTAEIRDMSVELQVNLKTGREILGRVKQIEAELDERFQSVAGTRAQIDGYEARLNDLFAMSERVDENLDRIHEESKFVDGVARRLKVTEGRLGGLERKIEQVVDDTDKRNRERLEATARQVDELNTARASELVAKVDEARQRVEDYSDYIGRLEARKEQMEQQLAAELDELSARALEKAGEHQERLMQTLAAEKDQLVSAATAEMTALVEKTNQQGQEATRRGAKLLADLKEQSKQTLESIKAREGSLQKNVEALRKETADAGEQLLRDLEARVSDLAAALEERQQDLDERLEQYRQQATAEHAELVQNLSERAGVIEVALDNRGEDLQALGEQLLQRAHETQAEMIGSIEEQASRAGGTIERTGSKFTEVIATAAREQDARRAELLGLLDERAKELEGLVAAGEVRLAEMAETAEASDRERRDRTTEAMERQAAEVQAQLGARARELDVETKKITEETAGIQQSLVAKIGELAASVEGDVARREAEMQKAADVVLQQTVERSDEMIAVFQNRVDQLVDAAQSRGKEIQEAIASSLRELNGDVSRSEESLRQRFQQLLEQTEGRRSELEEGLTAIVTRAEEKRNDVARALADDLAGYDADIAAVEAEYKERLESAAERGVRLEHEAFSALESSIQDRVRSIQSMIEEQAAKLGDQQQSVQKDLTDLNGRTRSDLKVWEAETLQLLKEKDRLVQDELEAIRQGIERQAAQSQERLDAMRALLDEAERVGTESAERLEAYRTSFLDRVDLASQELENDLAERSEERLRELEAGLSYHFGRLSTTAADMKELEANLRRVMEKVEGRLKGDFDGFIEELATRRVAEKEKSEEEIAKIRDEMSGLEDGLNNLKAQAYQSVSAKLKGFEQEFLEDLRRRSDGLEENLQSWQKNVERQMQQITDEGTSARRRMEEEYRDELVARIDQLKTLNEQRFAQIDEEMEGRIGAMQGDLERERRELSDQIDEIQSTLGQWRDQAEVQHREHTGKVSEALEELDRRAAELQSLLEEKTSSSLAGFKKAHEELAQDIQIRNQGLRDDIADQIRVFKNVGADIRTRVDETQSRLLSRIEEEYNGVSERLGQIERAQKDFATQTKLLEKVDAYKLDLERDIDVLRKELSALEPSRKDLTTIEGEYRNTRRLVDEVGGKLSRFLAEKRRVDSLEKDFNRLIGISKSIDVRLATVTAAGDTIDEVQLKLQELQSLQEEVDARYERLEKRQSILDATSDGVQSNLELLDQLASGVGEVREELKTLPARVSEIRGVIEQLSVDKERADAAVARLEQLEEVLGEVEERMEKLTTAREWLAKTETRLQSIGRQAQDHVKLLKTLVKSDGARKDRGAPPLDTRETVVKLSHQGWAPVEIARVTSISLGEVELILELAPQQK
jgi:DNA repair exonuclease SbcCD ATPase subunit